MINHINVCRRDGMLFHNTAQFPILCTVSVDILNQLFIVKILFILANQTIGFGRTLQRVTHFPKKYHAEKHKEKYNKIQQDTSPHNWYNGKPLSVIHFCTAAGQTVEGDWIPGKKWELYQEPIY